MYTISCRATKIKWNSFLGDPSIRQQIFEPWLLWPLEVSTNNDLLKKNPSKFARILQNSSHWGQTNKAIATTKIQCFFPIRSSGTHYTYFDMCINIDRLCMCRRYIHIIFAMYVFIFPSFMLTFFLYGETFTIRKPVFTAISVIHYTENYCRMCLCVCVYDRWRFHIFEYFIWISMFLFALNILTYQRYFYFLLLLCTFVQLQVFVIFVYTYRVCGRYNPAVLHLKAAGHQCDRNCIAAHFACVFSVSYGLCSIYSIALGFLLCIFSFCRWILPLTTSWLIIYFTDRQFVVRITQNISIFQSIKLIEIFWLLGIFREKKNQIEEKTKEQAPLGLL